MPDMLAAGVAWLNTQRDAYVSQTVTVTRASWPALTIQARRGETEFQIDTGEVIRLEANQVDWIMTAANYVINGVLTYPHRGDRFTVGTEVYEVAPPAEGMQPYRLDPTGLQLRAHTKRITTATV